MVEDLTNNERKKLERLQNEVKKRQEKEKALEFRENARNNRILDENGVIVTTIWAQTLKLIFFSFFFLFLGIALFWGYQSYIGNYKSSMVCNITSNFNATQICGNLSTICEKQYCNLINTCGNFSLTIINQNGNLTYGNQTNSTN